MIKRFTALFQPGVSISTISIAASCSLAFAVFYVLWPIMRESRLVFASVGFSAIALGYLVAARLLCCAREIERKVIKEKYRFLFDHSPQAMYIFDRANLGFLAVNEAALSRYQYTREEFLKMNLKDIRPATEIPKLLQYTSKPSPSPSAVPDTFTHRKKDGTTITVEIHEHDLEFDGRSARLVLAVDITEKCQALEELRKNQRLLKSIIDGTSDVIFAKDFRGRYIVCNSAAAKFIGKEVNEILGSQEPAWLLPHEAKFITETDRQTMAQKEVSTYEQNFTLPSGETVTFLVTKGPLCDAAGDISGVFGIARNISDRKAIEKNLRDAVRARDEFLSIASHELKTPITSLKLQSAVNRRMVAKGNAMNIPRVELLKYLERIEKQIDRLGQLVEEILDVSRIGHGKLPLRLEEVSFAHIATEVIDRLGPQIGAAGSKLDFQVKTEVNGRWDRYRLERMLTNLLTNAIKYGRGGPIHLAIDQHGTLLVVTVADQGIGILKEDQERIFKRFERGELAAGVSGLGLGLYIVKQVVDDHGGSVSVESEPGRGAKFLVTLPLRPEVAANAN